MRTRLASVNIQLIDVQIYCAQYLNHIHSTQNLYCQTDEMCVFLNQYDAQINSHLFNFTIGLNSLMH